MYTYIEKVLVPYLQEKAGGIPVLLFLDSFTVHHTPGITARLLELGITSHKIPGGCTGLIQPVDVGIGKPFKD